MCNSDSPRGDLLHIVPSPAGEQSERHVCKVLPDFSPPDKPRHHDRRHNQDGEKYALRDRLTSARPRRKVDCKDSEPVEYKSARSNRQRKVDDSTPAPTTGTRRSLKRTSDPSVPSAYHALRVKSPARNPGGNVSQFGTFRAREKHRNHNFKGFCRRSDRNFAAGT